MARKRLNKKLSLIGSFVFLIIGVFSCIAIPRLDQEPEKFIKDGDAAWQIKDYEKAQRDYLKAHKFAKTGSLRKEILFKLADVYIQTGQWPKVRGCWEQIINIERGNIEARLGRLKYIYIVADNYSSVGRGVSGIWEEVKSQTSELIDVVDGAGLSIEDRAKLEPSFGAE